MSSIQPSVLFVPGAMTGSWIWRDNFRAYFGERGFNCTSMDFSGHDTSFLKRNSMFFDDYVEQCVSAINRCPVPPIVIAHSMGGLIALHAATQTQVSALALLSPVPVTGMSVSLTSLAFTSPLSLLKFSAALVDARVTRFGAAPLGVYSDTCVPEQMQRVTGGLRGESLPVATRLLFPPKLNTAKLQPKRILFMGATGDHIVPAREVERSAKRLGSQSIIYPGLSHTFQAEADWPQVADDIKDWLISLT